MTFDSITQDDRLWATRYEGCSDNALDTLFDQWNDVAWLREFFKANLDDLISYFKITDVNDAIYDTIEDSERLQCLIMDISPEADLDKLFRPLENTGLRISCSARRKQDLKTPPDMRHGFGYTP